MEVGSIVHQQGVDACGARCQMLLNIFSSSVVLEEFNDVTKAWRMAAEDLVSNVSHFVKVGGCPQVDCVNGNFA